MKLLVSMGIRTEQPHGDTPIWRCDKAALKLIDWDSGRELDSLEYITPREFYPGSRDMQFKAGSICDDRFIVVTDTEVLFINLNGFSVDKRISLPSFNDLHYATVHNNCLYVVNTGLDIIQLLDHDGNIIEEVNTSYDPTWKRFDRTVDYRKVESTKPHTIHPNYVFFLPDGSRWITRFFKKDAICIDDNARSIDLNVSEGSPHDGKVIGDFIYFTITDSYIVVVNANTLKREMIINLLDLDSRRSIKKLDLGWCRGIHVDAKRAIVGFSKFRSSRSREYIHWIMQGFNSMDSRIAEYDLIENKLVKEIGFTGCESAAIYSINSVH